MTKAAIESHLDAIEEIVKRDPEALEAWLSDLEIHVRTRFCGALYGEAHGFAYRLGYNDAKDGREYDVTSGDVEGAAEWPDHLADALLPIPPAEREAKLRSWLPGESEEKDRAVTSILARVRELEEIGRP